jgi:hypothetical protein
MEIILSILMFVLASMWTIFMLLNQVIAFSTWHRIIPYETTTKILNLITHIILLSSIWISVLGIDSTATWILLLVSLIPFAIWFILSRIQNRYLIDKMDRLKAEFEKQIAKEKIYSAIIKEKKRKRRK